MKQALFMILSVIAVSCFSQGLSLEITGIRTDKGVIQLTLYRDKDSFADENPFKEYTVEKTGMIDGNITLTIDDISYGVYGIALIDDENENGKMDYRLFRPAEGFGFSNYHFKGVRKPDFDWFDFEYTENGSSVKIRVQYF